MSNDINERLEYLHVTSKSIEMVDTRGFDDHNDIQEKELRRISLPIDTYRKSKFASWVHYNVPTPPSSRTNSGSSSHGSRKSAYSSSSSSDPTSPAYTSPTSSPISSTAPSLPAVIQQQQQQQQQRQQDEDKQEKKVHTSRISSLPTGSLSITQRLHEEEEAEAGTEDIDSDTEYHQQRHSHHSLLSLGERKKKSKKRLFPLVSRIRLSCPTEKLAKTIGVDPPEPPPQLLLSALHCDEANKAKAASQNNIECSYDDDRNDMMPQVTTVTPATSSASSSTVSFPRFDGQHPPVTSTKDDSNNDGNLSSDICQRLRRRSSCPSKPTDHTAKRECVMMRSFCSPVNSPTPNQSNTRNGSPSPMLVENDVYDNHQQRLLSFSSIKPRTRPLRRRHSGRRERKALRVWHDALIDALKKEQESDKTWSHSTIMSDEKRERNALTRKFILREFYLTEVTFWNQLYYSKVMFSDTLQLSIDRHSPFTRVNDMDIFSNLPDLMQCSSHLIRSMASFLDHPPCDKLPASTPSTPTSYEQAFTTANEKSANEKSAKQFPPSAPPPPVPPHDPPLSAQDTATEYSSSSTLVSPSTSISSSTFSTGSTLPIHLNADSRMLPSPNDQLLLGKEICAMAEQFVVFLRCAVDYKTNRKKLDQRVQHNKGFAVYQEKLALRKETNQFHVHDYLIIPIQRITRYGLLLSDLQKHTEKEHPDYHYIGKARMIMTSLAVAMNKAQH